MGIITLRPTSALTPPWTNMSPVSLGDGQTREYLLVEEDGVPRLRFDLCRAGSEAWFRTEAIWWRDRIVVGFGERVFIVDLMSLETHCIKLREYFNGLYPGDEWLLVVSGTDITRLDSTGHVVWRSGCLGIDGIVVHKVSDVVISGEGEWNPPGGWIPFMISFADGSAVSSGAIGAC
jgi:hypothetical protein